MTAPLALSSAQTGVWMAQQLDPDDRSFNIGEYCDIEGPVDPVLFEAALREVVATTPALRARFDIGDEGLCQYVDDFVDVPLHHIDVSGEPDALAAAERWMRRDLAKEYDLAKGPLFTWALFTLGAGRTLWYRAAHHIVVDGFGLSLIASHVADVYTSLVTGRPRRPRPPGTLEQVIEADTAYQDSEEYADDRRFWLSRLADQTEVASLTDWRPPRGRAALRVSGHLPPSDVEVLRAAARRLEVTLPEVIIAAVAVQLYRATGVRELVVGLPVTGRTEPLMRRVPAMLTNVVPLRYALSSGLDFAAVVEQTSHRLEEAIEHQRYPQEHLAREIPGLPKGRRQFGPDVNIMSFPYRGDYAGHSAVVHSLSPGPVEDLSINVYDRLRGQGLEICFYGNTELYGHDQLAGHLSDFLSLLRSVDGLRLT
ncbi:condensation domain-containing protein [Streptomyces cyanogenus]|uniref:Dimodular nonribosomal peptide synthase n=1 Tax=Streptomyces cyanogenus TaxID=80860 RepID=A0ABX7TJB3_STRCY|nr:condensation domain-containing protein [Streptomyces cyanogenus]QTD96737.1 Dimodular nonribosomal peptide synthase [Streptomyces cyanogenus]